MPPTVAVPSAVYLRLWSRLALSGPDWTQRILDVFESVPELLPTHWGPDDRARSKYSRQDAIAYAASRQPDSKVPMFRRTSSPRYLAYADTAPGGPAGFKVDFDGAPRAQDIVPIYRLADALAGRMQPEFGFVHEAFADEGCRGFGKFGVYKSPDFARYGPQGLAVRTWLGPHMLRLLDRDRLERLRELGLAVKDAAWGGVRIDLGSPPWETDCQTLLARHAQAMDVLRESGIFGDYSGLRPTAGPRWAPPPLPTPPPASPAKPSLPPAVQHLKQAVLAKQQVENVDISGLDLKHIDLTELNAPGLRANGAHLEGALLTGARLVDAFIAEAHLDNAHLAGANLTQATFEGTSLRNASLERATIAFAYCNKADLTEADLTGANLEETTFADSRFDRAILRNVNATNTVFSRASLVGADLHQGQFVDAAFRQADLTSADLSEGDFSEADFRGAQLDGVNWQGAKLDRAQFDQTNGASH